MATFYTDWRDYSTKHSKSDERTRQYEHTSTHVTKTHTQQQSPIVTMKSHLQKLIVSG